MVPVNGSSGATAMEMLVVASAVKCVLDAKRMTLAICKTGEMLTVQEMASFQLIVAKVDDEIVDVWNDSCRTPAWAW